MGETVESLKFQQNVDDEAEKATTALGDLIRGFKATTAAAEEAARAAKGAADAVSRVRQRDERGRFLPGQGRAGAAGAGALGGESAGVDKLRDSIASVTTGAGSARTAVAAIGTAAAGVAGAVAGIATALGGVAYLAGKATVGIVEMSVSAAGFKANTLAGLEAMLGSKKAAADTYERIKAFADLTPFDTRDVGKFYQSLLGAGFAAGETEELLKGLFDVAARNEFDTNIAKSMILAVGQIRGKGRLLSEELNQIIENSANTVSRTAVYQQLAKLTGKSIDETIKLLETGKIDSEKGIKAILEVIRTGVSGGELGALSKKLGLESVPGLLSNIRGNVFKMFEGVDITPVEGSLKNVVSAFAGTEGKNFTKAVTDLGTSVIKTLFGPFEGEEGKAKIEAFMRTATQLAKDAKEVFDELRPVVKDVVDILSVLFGAGGNTGNKTAETLRGILDLTQGILTGDTKMISQGLKGLFDIGIGPAEVISGIQAVLTGGVSAVTGWIAGAAVSLGTELVNGIVDGISSGVSAVVGAVSDLASRAVQAAQGVLKIRSPSKVFEEIGGYGAEGMVLGFAGGGGDVGAAGLALGRRATKGVLDGLTAAAAANDNGGGAGGAPAASASSGARRPAGGALGPIEVHIHLHGSVTADDVDRDLEPAVVRAVERALRRIALEAA